MADRVGGQAVEGFGRQGKHGRSARRGLHTLSTTNRRP